MEKKTIRDIDVKGKKVLVRVDFNVPTKDGEITDDTRIKAALPTIEYLIENGAKIVLCSHLGRPKGQVNEKYTLKPVANQLSEELGIEVKMANDVTGESAQKMASELEEGEVGLLENVRFDPREEKNDDTLAMELAALIGEDGIYVNDAFGTAHRAHSSTEGVTHHVNEAVAGLLMEKEVEELGAVLEEPKKPFVAILGGAKVSDKIGVIESLINKVDKILIGGAMANTFLKAKGIDIGSSRYEEDKIKLAKEIMKNALEAGVEIVLPKDAKAANIKEGEELSPETVSSAEIKNVTLQKDNQEGKTQDMEGLQILDVANATLLEYADAIEGAKTIFWNGPVGYTEAKVTAQGTTQLANFISNTDAKCIIGGGDSVASIKKIMEEAGEKGFEKIYLSTGGGASLEFIEGKELPGIVALDDKSTIRKKEAKAPKTLKNEKSRE